jgi:hypothetical protein
VPERCITKPSGERKKFFSEEKKPKDFYFLRSPHLSGHGPDLSAGADSKVFWFFSSEKNTLHFS